jgi:lipopolysaccharide assembly outer membrane protein LptD (OstA)
VRCRSPNVPANCETPVDRGGSAWVADSTWQINDRWSVGGSYQWDPKFRRQDLASAGRAYLIGDEGVANLSYRYRRNLLEQVDLSFLYPITPPGAWSAAITIRCIAMPRTNRNCSRRSPACSGTAAVSRCGWWNADISIIAKAN